MKKFTVLIVDDILMNRILLKEVLSEIAKEIKEAENGLEAIEKIKQGDIDVVFMDIEMPKMNGLETTQYIRNKMPSPINSIPIIALTAHNPLDFFEDYSTAGFNDIITKPYSFEKIKNAITSLTNED
ncbi:MAG: response regulator [Bacteroidetes bacterium]|nr:response regulator [Bacteroidota bacterium]